MLRTIVNSKILKKLKYNKNISIIIPYLKNAFIKNEIKPNVLFSTYDDDLLSNYKKTDYIKLGISSYTEDYFLYSLKCTNESNKYLINKNTENRVIKILDYLIENGEHFNTKHILFIDLCKEEILVDIINQNIDNNNDALVINLN